MRGLLVCCIGLMLAVGAWAVDWPQWRGPNRDGISAEVPLKLPAKQLLWRRPLSGEGHAGLAAAGGFLVVADRGEGKDIIRCFTEAGEIAWTREYACAGEIEFGFASRATPLIAGGSVYTLGAFGNLACWDLKSGKEIWAVNLAKQFGVKVPQWGFCSSPLLADGKLIINPGAEEASLVALDPKTGELLWKAPGKPSGYSSFITGTFGGVRQLVGYDLESLGGWDIATGKRLWTLTPENTGDYNVGTPVNVNGQLLVATENNAARLYAFGKEGKIVAKPVADNGDLAPDMATPVVYKGMAFATWYGLLCLDTTKGLKPLWKNEKEDALSAFSSMIAGNNRVMVFTESGVLYLVAADGKQCQILGKMELCKKTWSHPALANGKLYIRDAKWVYCYSMK